MSRNLFLFMYASSRHFLPLTCARCSLTQFHSDLFHGYTLQYVIHRVRERREADDDNEIGQRAVQWTLFSLELISYQ